MIILNSKQASIGQADLEDTKPDLTAYAGAYLTLDIISESTVRDYRRFRATPLGHGS